MRVDQAGNLVFADTTLSRIRVVATTSGTFYGRAMKAGDIYTVAGDGTPAFAGDGGLATEASIALPGRRRGGPGRRPGHRRQRQPAGPLRAGHLGHVLRPGHEGQAHLHGAPGNGTPGFGGDGGPATAAQLNFPRGVALDSAGNLVIADWANALIRLVAAHSGTFYGQAMTTGDIYTIGGVPGDDGNEFSGDGGPALRAEFGNPTGIATDRAGDMLIADQGNGRVRMIPASGGTYFGQAMKAGDVYTVAGDGTLGFGGDGGPAVHAELNFPGDVAFDRAGNLVIADTYNSRIRVVAATTGTFYGQPMTVGHIYTVAGDGKAGPSGDGGPATSAELELAPTWLTRGRGGQPADRRHGATTRVRVVAGQYRHVLRPGHEGRRHLHDRRATEQAGFGGDGGPGTSAELDSPEGAAVDGAGNVLIADLFNNRIRVVAGQHRHVLRPGHDGRAHLHGGGRRRAQGFGGDGGPATSAALHWPYGVTVDGPATWSSAMPTTTGSGWSRPRPARSTACR